MNSTIIISIIFGSFAVVLIAIVIKNIASPKKVDIIAKLLKSGKYQAAIKSAKIYLNKDPRNPLAHYLLGQALLADQKFEQALMEFKIVNQTAIFGHEISETTFRQTISKLYQRFDQDEEALKEYLLLIKLEPFEPSHYYNTGKLFEKRGKTDLAVNYYKKSIEVNPRFSDSHTALGLVYYRNKQFQEAKTEFNSSIKYNPENIESYFYLGKIMKENNDYAGALEAFDKAQRSPDFKLKSLIERGTCYMNNNSIEKAIIELERAVKNLKNDIDTESLYARYFLAICYEKTRNLDKAIDQLEKIYSRKPAFRDVAQKLSQYQDFRTNDNMKEFMTASHDKFLNICMSVVQGSMDLVIREQKDIKNGCEIIAIESESEKWRNMRKQPHLIRFYRMTDLIEDSTIRTLQEDMKKLSIIRGHILCSTGFTRSALQFAENRPIELFDKEKLEDLLDRSNLYGKK